MEINYIIMFIAAVKIILFLIALIDTFYLLVLAPFLFRFWIIPKIISRFNVAFDYNYPEARVLGAGWTYPPMEISWYVLATYMKWQWIIDRYHLSSMPFFKNIQYDINHASHREIIVSIITMIITFSLIFCILTGSILEYCFPDDQQIGIKLLGAILKK